MPNIRNPPPPPPFVHFCRRHHPQKFMIGQAIMSNFLVCSLACISVVRDKHDEGIKEMCSAGIPGGGGGGTQDFK